MSNPTNQEQPSIPRVTGLLIIEARNSNPNGDPDRESDPRTRSHDGKGLISDVSYKRKLRELVLNKQGPVWKDLAERMKLEENRFGIHVDDQTRKQLAENSGDDAPNLCDAHWDVRVFGSTALEEGKNFIRTGVVQFGIGVSLAKVRIQRDTNTVKANVDASKDADRGMAPLGFRIVEHGVYAMPFLVNPTAAVHSGCTQDDIELLCRLIPYAYPHNPSRVRPFVDVRHAWYFEHSSPLGSVSDFTILDKLTPEKASPSEPSTSWEDYNYDSASVINAIQEDFKGKFAEDRFGDLCNSEFVRSLFSR